MITHNIMEATSCFRKKGLHSLYGWSGWRLISFFKDGG
jgi:hypothetical protein